MRFLKPLAVVLLACALPAFAQNNTASLTAQDSGACTTAGACLSVRVPPGFGGGAVILSGTFSATAQFEVSGDRGATFVALNVIPSNSSTQVTSATGVGVWQVNVAGYTDIRIRISAYTSGTVTAYINLSTVAVAGGGGGGGGGVVTQPVGTNLHMVCDSGCSSSAGFGDNSAFTVGTTAINPIGGLYDTGADPTITNGSAARARVDSHSYLYTDLATPLPAGTNVIGHTINDSGSTTAVTGNVAVTKADGSDVTLGAKADAKSTATDTTAITLMQVFKEMSAMLQAPASTPVTGTFWPYSLGQQLAAASVPVILPSATITTLTPPPAITNFANETGGNLAAIKTDVDKIPASPSTSANQCGTGGTPCEIAGHAGASFDAATGAAPPANVVYVGGLCSGATGGFLCGIPISDTTKNVNISTATTTLIVTGVASRQVRIGAMHLIATGADNLSWIEGTGATCGTGTAAMRGATTNSEAFVANQGFTEGTGLGTILQTATSGDSVCLVTSAAVQLSGNIMYTIY